MEPIGAKGGQMRRVCDRMAQGSTSGTSFIYFQQQHAMNMTLASWPKEPRTVQVAQSGGPSEMAPRAPGSPMYCGPERQRFNSHGFKNFLDVPSKMAQGTTTGSPSRMAQGANEKQSKRPSNQVASLRIDLS